MYYFIYYPSAAVSSSTRVKMISFLPGGVCDVIHEAPVRKHPLSESLWSEFSLALNNSVVVLSSFNVQSVCFFGQ